MVHSIGFDDGARFVQSCTGVQRGSSAESAMHPFTIALGLRMIRMRTHVGHAGGLTKLRQLVANEKRSAVMHDLGLTRTTISPGQGVNRTLSCAATLMSTSQ
jgi:hypothetical protein